MELDRDEFLMEVAYKLANVREVCDAIKILMFYGVTIDSEIAYCLSAATVINGEKLDRVTEELESIKGADLSQEDKMLLN